MDGDEVLFREESYAIQGAVFEVYRELGCGFLEAVYQECLERELYLRGIPFEAQRPLSLTYKDWPLQLTYKPDIVCYGKIIVELKAVKEIALGLLVNFGAYPKATVNRMANTRKTF